MKVMLEELCIANYDAGIRPGWSGETVSEKSDGWGERIVIVVDAGNLLAVQSCGPDRVLKTSDDIVLKRSEVVSDDVLQRYKNRIGR